MNFLEELMVVNVKIDGTDKLKNIVTSQIKKALKLIGGEIHLFVDNSEVNIHEWTNPQTYHARGGM